MSEEIEYLPNGVPKNYATMSRPGAPDGSDPKNPVRVYADGVFDMYHVGHAKVFEQAKKLFKHCHLIVGVSGDEETIRKKGKIVMNQDERTEVIRHCKWVDDVICPCPWVISVDWLKEQNIHYVAHDDLPYGSVGQDDIYTEVKKNLMFRPTQRTEGISTTDIIGRIIRDFDLYAGRMLARGAAPEEMGLTAEQAKKYRVKEDVAPLGSLYVSDPSSQHLALVLNQFATSKATVKCVIEADYKKDKDFLKKNPSGSFPCMEVDDTMITHSAVSLHQAEAGDLLGSTPFQAAQVNQMVVWSDQNQLLVNKVVQTIYGHRQNANYAEDLAALKSLVKTLNQSLNKKQWLVGDKLSLADLACGVMLMPAFQLVLDSGFRKSMSNVAKWFEAFIALPQVIQICGNIQCAAKAQKPPGEPAAKKAKKELTELEEIFGDSSDDREAIKAAEACKERTLAKLAKGKEEKKKIKKPVIAQSLVVFEVKPLDDTTDLDAMAKKVLEISQDGLYWKTEYKKEPVAFGIFKIIIGCTVEDEKVSVDGLVEKIEAIEDMVQSVEILAFNKI